MARTAVITGAGSGIGRATADAFLQASWQVAVIGRRAETLREVISGHETSLAIPCDITDEKQVHEAFAKIQDRFDRLDVLFNNAGIFTPAAPLDEIKLADWKDTVDVNLTGAFLCARAAFGIIRHQTPQGGRIINNGSISAQVPRAGSAPYTSTKHAITGLTKSIALDGRPYNITCGQIDIGNANTEMVARLNAAAEKPDPVMSVNEAAEAILHMASLPLGTNILSMTIMASQMPFVGRG